MEGAADAGVERGAVERRRPLGQGEVLEPRRLRLAGEPEGASGPVGQPTVLQRRQRQPLARLDRVGRHLGLVAEEHRLRVRLHADEGRVAEKGEEALAKRRVLRRAVGEARAPRLAQEVARRVEAVALEEALVHPLEVGHPPEDRPDVALEDRLRRAPDPGRDERRFDRVVDGDDARGDPRRVVRRDAEDPRRIGLEGPAADPDGGADRAVAGVVGPAAVVGEAGHGRRFGGPVGAAGAGEHHQPPRCVGHRLAEGHGHRHEGAAVERDRSRAGALEGTRARPHDQARPVGDVAVPPSRARRALDVEGDVDLVPGGLGVGDRDPPGDVDVGGGELADDAAVGVIAEEAEARRLSGHGAGRILERPGGERARHLGPEEEGVAAVADAGDADRRMNRDPRHPVEIGRADRRGEGTSAGRERRRERRDEGAPRQEE